MYDALAGMGGSSFLLSSPPPAPPPAYVKPDVSGILGVNCSGIWFQRQLVDHGRHAECIASVQSVMWPRGTKALYVPLAGGAQGPV